MKENNEGEEDEEDIDNNINNDINDDINNNNIIINDIISISKISSTKENSDSIKEEQASKPKYSGRPKMKHPKMNKTEDIELQIACEDASERKERLQSEKLKQKEIKLKNKNIIYSIDEENYSCVDCGNKPSNFISINNGVTLCSVCAEIHKKFGYDVSFVLNINDELDEYLFSFIAFGSNTKFKIFLEKENFDTNLNLNLRKKYRTNVVSFYRKNLKNKVEGKILINKNYENPNEINNNLYNEDNNSYPQFDAYILKNQIIKNGELIKQNKFINFVSNLFSKKKKKKKILLKPKLSVTEKLNKENQEEHDNEKDNKLNINSKKNSKSIKIDLDIIKGSSRPLNDEQTETDKTAEIEDNPKIRSNTSEPMMNNYINNN